MILVGLVLASVSYWTGLFFAWLEIEIEGPHPWASSNRYTWRCGRGVCGNGLPLTGYHLTMFVMVLSMGLGSYVVVRLLGWQALEIADLLAVIAFYFYVVLVEDYEWYNYNHEFRETRGALPFGSEGNRVLRYAINFLVLSVFWVAAYTLRNTLTGALFSLGYSVAWMALILIVEQFTLLPLYTKIRKNAVDHTARHYDEAGGDHGCLSL